MRTYAGGSFEAAPGHEVNLVHMVGTLDQRAVCSCGWRGDPKEVQGHVFKAAIETAPEEDEPEEPKRVTLSIRVDTEAVQRAIRAVQELGEALSALQVTLEDVG